MVKSFFTWWYRAGLLAQISKTKIRLVKITDSFSMKQLSRTLFAPFHQYSANETGRSISEKFQAWLNRSFSRIFGFFIRIFTILLGCVSLLVVATMSGLWLVIWLSMPFAPIIYTIIIVLGGF